MRSLTSGLLIAAALICTVTQYCRPYDAQRSANGTIRFRERVRGTGRLVLASFELVFCLVWLIYSSIVPQPFPVLAGCAALSVLCFASAIVIAMGIWPPRKW